MSKKHNKKHSSGNFKATTIQQIISIFDKNPTQSFNYKKISNMLGLKGLSNRKLVGTILDELANQGKLFEYQRGSYKRKSGTNFVEGKVDMTQRGAAYVVVEDAETDIYIHPKNIKNALNGDLVKVNILSHKTSDKIEGEIVEVIKRAKTSFVGIIQKSKNFAFLAVEDARMGVDIFIANENLKGAKDGDKAVARITEWPDNKKNPYGIVVDVLGRPGDNNTEMHAILAEYGLPYAFPPKVENEAQQLPIEITAQEIKKRRDFRAITTFTIDPADAKDFDDALSIQKLTNGNWEIGIHIADVSHYIQRDSILDKEAYQRATSIYLVDRVVPMLPEKLSNGVCSLRPQETKLCFSAVFELNEDAKVLSEWFGRTVIFSDRRFTYEEAQERIETKQGDFVDELLIMDKLAKKLRKERFKAGAISFDRLEVKFNIDENGKPLGLFFKESKDANKLIEEFMLLANKKVAEFVGKPKNKNEKPKSFVYRIHDEPNQEKLQTLSNFVKKFGYTLATKSNEIATSINTLLEDVKGKAEENMIEQLTVRTMAKAIYSTKNIGHYGLSFSHYSHFTSPIRRYPDVMVHRLLQFYLDGGNSVSQTELEAQCKHSSEMEMLASEAERKSIKYKQVEFLEDKIGQVFEGIISGVSEWGIYVEIIENMCEGMVRMQDLDGDFYSFDKDNYCAKGRKTGHEYKMGDKVMIKVKRADLIKKQLDFELI